MTTRFTPYGNHQRSWWLHTASSDKFKEWYQSHESHQDFFHEFVEDPEKFIHNHLSYKPKDQ